MLRYHSNQFPAALFSLSGGLTSGIGAKVQSPELQSREEGDRARSKRRACHFSGGGGGRVSRGGSMSATSVVCGSECHVIIQSVSSNLDCLVLVDCCLSGTMTTLKFEVPLFDGRTDFMLWQCTIQDYLVQQGLDLALQDEKPSDMKESEWSTILKKAASTIRLALSPQIKVTVLKETSPKKLWETLESKFASKTLTNRLMMRMDLYSLKMEEGGSVIDHINKFNEQVSRLLNAGETIKDEEQGLLLLASLPKSFKPFV
ncbi:unnamed protein product [Cuscuta campestris]|uniref:Retrotransposon Copia-like N-terminal domain-containing protein n=1 Tax=Cuscuta campestris TaxID=132261 RepID=A0A484LSV6_9ASTE|nr:unnamed protein product [Cuscuta campestris]